MTTPKVVGLDLSLTSTGIALVDGGTLTVKAGDRRGMDRIDWILGELMTRASLYSAHPRTPDLVAIEGYSLGSRASHAHAAGELGGAVRLYLHRAGIPWIDVPPAVVKKYATGKGNAEKASVVSCVTRLAGRVFFTDDEADAWVLRAIGLDYLGAPNLFPTAYRTEALEKLRAV